MRHVLKLILVTLVCLCFAATPGPMNWCLANDQTTKSAEGQKILFAQHYVNHAWGHVNRGTYIDSNGDLYSFDLSSKEPSKVSLPQQLEKKDCQRKLITKIDSETLSAKRKLIETASHGEYSPHKNTAFDAGTWVTSGYIYDDKKASYKEIELAVSGDWSYRNLSPAAIELVDWLNSLNTGSNQRPPESK